MRKLQKAIIVAAVVIIVLGFCGVCAAMGGLLYYLIQNQAGHLSMLADVVAVRMV